MNVLRLSAAAAVALATGIVAHASGPIAVYAKVDRVVMEPNEQAPERIQVWGVFSLSSAANGNSFSAPVRGYLYYRLPTPAEDRVTPELNRQTTLNEWKDLKTVAGTNDIYAFGAQYKSVPTLRKSEQKPESPDVFTLNIGIRRVNAATSTFPPIVALRDFKQ